MYFTDIFLLGYEAKELLIKIVDNDYSSIQNMRPDRYLPCTSKRKEIALNRSFKCILS